MRYKKTCIFIFENYYEWNNIHCLKPNYSHRSGRVKQQFLKFEGHSESVLTLLYVSYHCTGLCLQSIYSVYISTRTLLETHDYGLLLQRAYSYEHFFSSLRIGKLYPAGVQLSNCYTKWVRKSYNKIEKKHYSQNIYFLFSKIVM